MDEPFCISMACLAPDAKGAKQTVWVTVEDRKFVVCHLIPGKIEQQQLNLQFDMGEELSLSVEGGSRYVLIETLIDTCIAMCF